LGDLDRKVSLRIFGDKKCEEGDAAKYVRPYSKGQKNDFRDAEAIAEAVQRPTMKFVATKSADQLDLQALHRVGERLVSQRTGIIYQIRAFLLERGVRRSDRGSGEALKNSCSEER
jgi:transposase